MCFTSGPSCCCWVAQSCPTLCDPMDGSTPGFPVLHYRLGLAQTHVHWVSDAVQPSHPLSALSPPALNLSQDQGLFQWVGSLQYPYARTYLTLNIFTKPYLPLLVCDATWFLTLLCFFKGQLDPLNWCHKSLMDCESSVCRHLLLLLGRVTPTTKSNSNKVVFHWPWEQSGIPRRRAVLQLVYVAFGLGRFQGSLWGEGDESANLEARMKTPFSLSIMG